MGLSFTLGELLKNIDVIQKFKRVFGIDEHAEQDELNVEELGIKKNGVSKIFTDNSRVCCLVTDIEDIKDRGDYGVFNAKLLKQAFDILNDNPKNGDDIRFLAKKDFPSIMLNEETKNAVIVSPIVEEEETEEKTKKKKTTEETEGEEE